MSAPMTPRERWTAILNRQPTDRPVTDYWTTPEFHAALKVHLGIDDDETLWRRLGIDRPRWTGARLVRNRYDDGKDMWGIRYRRIAYGTGSYDEADGHPLAGDISVDDVERYDWPDAEDFDYSPVGDFFRADDRTRPVHGPSYEPFLLYCSLRGMEQAYEDLLLNPEIADAILGKLFDFFYAHNRRTFEAAERAGAGYDFFYLAEDLGGQTGPLFSLDVYRRFLRPNQKRMADLAHAFGAKVFYHTDGAVRAFLDDLIDIVGIDLLNPIQWRCPTMEVDALVRDFGSRVLFHGAIDNQQTLPFGTEQDVRDEVELMRGKFAGARWICAPCHNIQPVTPPRNVVAMYDQVHRRTPA